MVLEGHVPITTVGTGLGEGEPQFPNEARWQPASLDELEEHFYGRAHIPVLHQSRWIQLGEASEVGLCESLH